MNGRAKRPYRCTRAFAARSQVIVEYPVVAPLPLKDHEKVRVTIESVENWFRHRPGWSAGKAPAKNSSVSPKTLNSIIRHRRRSHDLC